MFSTNKEERATEIKGVSHWQSSRRLEPIFPDFLAKLEQRDSHVRESWVKAMEARLVREELDKCQRSEGVNHYESCRWLSEKYLTMLRENKVRIFRELSAGYHIDFVGIGQGIQTGGY